MRDPRRRGDCRWLRPAASDRRSIVNAEQTALTADRQLGMIAVNEARRSGALTFRTSSLKIPLHDELVDLGVQLLDLAFAIRGSIASQQLQHQHQHQLSHIKTIHKTFVAVMLCRKILEH